jgi:hypothetical protein
MEVAVQPYLIVRRQSPIKLKVSHFSPDNWNSALETSQTMLAELMGAARDLYTDVICIVAGVHCVNQPILARTASTYARTDITITILNGIQDEYEIRSAVTDVRGMLEA